MSKVGQKDTKPELLVRHIIHSMGFRYRLHRRDLPGSPDLVFPKYSKVIFVHGCFWHGHKGCKKFKIPETNSVFWKSKFERNRDRDQRVINALTKLGWKSLVIWQCQIENLDTIELQKIIKAFLIG